MKWLLCLFSVLWTASSITIGSKDSSLDPGKITWWLDTWSTNAIELTQTNQGTTGVTFTFHYRPSTSISNGIVQVTFPSSIPITGGQTQTIATGEIKGQTDYHNAIGSITLPSSQGVFGPFAIVTRASSTGQIVDANYFFGCIATSAATITSSSLTVTTVGGADSPIVSSTDGVSFNFTLTTSLWKHDIIEIGVDQNWKVSNSTCSSVTVSENSNLLYGPAGDNNLPCQTDSTGNVFIYGISQDVLLTETTTSLKIKISVSTFTLPSVVLDKSTFSWSVYIWRWGANNLLASYGSVSGPVSTNVGAVTVSSWSPLTSLASSDVLPGMTLFTNLTFVTSHDIPAGGKITVDFKDVDISNTYWWEDLDGSNAQKSLCYVPISKSSCSVASSTEATISFKNKQPAGSISLIILPAFSTTEGLTSVSVDKITTSDSTHNIDTTSSGFSWPFSKTNKNVFSKFMYHAYDNSDSADKIDIYPDSDSISSGNQYGGTDSARILWFKFLPSQAWDTTTTISVNFPFSTTTVQYTSSYIDTANSAVDSIQNKGVKNSDSTITYSIITDANTITLASNEIDVALKDYTLSSGNYYVFGYKTHSGSVGKVALPFVASNKATFYECWAKATTLNGGPLYDIDSYVFTVTIKDNPNYISTKPLCYSNTGGAPIVNTFMADTMAFDFSTGTYFIDITATGGEDLGTGLSSGSSIPLSSTASSASATLTYSSSGSDAVIKLTGLGLTSTTEAITTFIPTYGNKYSYASIFYYTSTVYPDINFQLYSHSQDFSESSGTSNAFTTAAATDTTTLTINKSAVLSMSLQAESEAIPSNNYWLVIGFPQGFTIASSASITLGSASPSTSYRVSSPNMEFSGAFWIGKLDNNFYLSSQTRTLIVDSVLPPSWWYSESDDTTSLEFRVFVAKNDYGNQCYYGEKIPGFYLQAGTLSEPTFSPASVTYRGPDSVDTTITISFSTVNPIRAGGTFKVELSSFWDYTYSTCSVTGLSDQSSTSKVSCAFDSDHKWITVSQFAALTASAPITISIYHLLVPQTGTTSPVNYIKSMHTADSISYNYIDVLATSSSTCTLQDEAAVGSTSGWTATAYPNQAGIPGVDFLLSFSLSKKVPAAGTISISAFDTWQYSSSDIKNSCWSNIAYSSCTYSSSSSSQIVLTLSQDVQSSTTIQIYLDNALNLPSSSGETTGVFKVSSEWHGIQITSDTTGFKFTVNPAVTGTLIPNTTNSLTMSITNAAEYSSHTFRFNSSQVATSDVFWIVFPEEYDPYIGKSDNYLTDCDPYKYFIPCSSSALGSITCTADHWYVVVSGIDKTVGAGSLIDITIDDIMNPAKGTTLNFEVYHLDSAGTVKAYEDEYGKVTTTDLTPNTVIFKSLSSDHAELREDANYTLEFYYASAVNSTLRFEINLPMQYDNTLEMGDTTNCTTVYYDQSGKVNTSSTTALDWHNGDTCIVEKDRFVFEASTVQTLNFNSTDMFSLEIEASNPQWGFARYSKDFDYWDIEDNTTFSWHDYWSNRFEIKIYNDTAKLVLGKSYGVLNSAYIGYNRSYTPIDVNEYTPQKSVDQPSDNRIKLRPGIQSDDITISLGNWPMKSKKLVLTPSSNPNYPDDYTFQYSSTFHNWTIFQMYSSMTFRLAALKNATSGLYYIDWSTEETLQEGVSSNRYTAPYSILVEICEPKSESVAITVGSIPNLIAGFTSIPISVTLGAAPATDITVWLSFDNSPSNIQISPRYLMFGPDENTKYFELWVNSSYATTQKAPVLRFDLSGTNSALYSTPNTISLTVNAASTTAYSAATVTLGSTIIDGNHAQVTVSSTQNVVIYWALACSGTPMPALSTIKKNCKDLVYPTNDTMSLYEQRSWDYLNTETDLDPVLDVDYFGFFRRQHRDHCSSSWYDMEVLYGGSSITLDLTWLHASTSYDVFVYADNRLYTSTLQGQSTSFSTGSLPDVYTYTVSFSASVSSTKGDDIRNAIAKSMGVNPGWLTNQKVSNQATSRMRMLASSTTFTYEVVYDRSKNAYSPSVLIGNIDTDQLTSDLTALTSSTPTYSSGAATSSYNSYPSWIRYPVLAAIGQTNVTFIGTPTQSGIMCVSCSPKEYETLTTYSWQIIDGLDGYSEVTPGSCSNSTANKNITMIVDGMIPGTPYNCSFTACNDYPLWPTCIDVATTPSVSTLPIYTILTYEIDGASMLGLLVTFFLVFN